MKKILSAILISAILVSSCSCNSRFQDRFYRPSDDTDTTTQTGQTTPSPNDPTVKYPIICQQNERYRVTKLDASHTSYELYDQNGDLFFADACEGVVVITEQADQLIVRTSYADNKASLRFCDLTTEKVSREFHNPLTYTLEGNRIACLGGIQRMRFLTVNEIYQMDFYAEMTFALPSAELVDNPILSISFKDGEDDLLIVTYETYDIYGNRTVIFRTDPSYPQVAIDLSDYDGVLNAYRALVEKLLYIAPNPSTLGETETLDSLFSFEYPSDYEKLYKLYNHLYRTRPQYPDSQERLLSAYGYTLRDLNKDGSDELILMTDTYNILAIYTLQDGKPVPLDYFRSLGDTAWIDAQNRLHVYRENSNPSHYSYVLEITAEGKEEVLLTLIRAYDPKTYKYNYHRSADFTTVDLSLEEYNALRSTYGVVDGNTGGALMKTNEFPFTHLFGSVTVDDCFYLDVWSGYYEEKFVYGMLYINIEPQLTIQFFCDNMDMHVAVYRNGANAEFSNPYVSGTMEFTAYNIWMTIKESTVSDLPCGTYLLTRNGGK
ncbi:MAG: hypothetical protein IJW16_02355 [Clostridia bacterium]|nr:hypothetical protein [Clostridia bacterium]